MFEMEFLSGVLLGVQFISLTGVLPLNGGRAAASCTSSFLTLCNYCVSKKSWPILYSKLLYKMGQYFLDNYYLAVMNIERIKYIPCIFYHI